MPLRLGVLRAPQTHRPGRARGGLSDAGDPGIGRELLPRRSGIGDPYYPAYGNGGYDVSHYDLRLKYQPATDELEGTATLLARATQDLSRFNLDFLPGGQRGAGQRTKASFKDLRRAGAGDHAEDTAAQGHAVSVVVRYSGVPSSKQAYGFTSWHRTPDGGVAAKEPESAGWWYLFPETTGMYGIQS